jgi:drug/metabolite transporter (DMT)-like permease
MDHPPHNRPPNESAIAEKIAPASATASPSIPRAEPEHRSVFLPLWPLLAGVLVGIGLRMIFSGGVELQDSNTFIDKVSNGVASAMSGFFIYFTPIAVSAVTVYLAERVRRRTWSYYFWMGALANAPIQK